MKIGFISDLHVDNQHYQISDYLKELAYQIRQQELELFIIGGDISNHYQLTLRFVEELQDLAACPVYFIPGNHDFWERKQTYQKIDSLKIYEHFRQHPQSLLEAPIQLNGDYGLVGHTAWYNYAYYNQERFNLKEIASGKYKGVTWQDKKFINWQQKDQEISKYFADLVAQDMRKLMSKKIILVTHIVTIPQFTMPIPHRIFDFYNAYIATNDFNEIYRNYPISHSLMGHVHFRHRHQEEATQYHANSLGYVKEWRSKDMRKEIVASLVIIEI